MLAWIVESFFPKVGEKLVDYGVGIVMGSNDYNFTSETLERNLKSLSAKAYDVEEEIKNGELSGKKKRKREVENWLKELKEIESEFLKLENEVQVEGFIQQFFGGGRAKNLSARVGELVEQSQHFGELLHCIYGTEVVELRTRELVGEAFKKNLDRIWKFLESDRVSSIGIHGMGGVGKTTLTKHIHNRLLKETAYCVYWVTVSQETSITMLQDKIADVVGLSLSDEYDEDKRAARLFHALSQKKNFVPILDDVWECISLEKVGDPLCVECCRLIVTTRLLEVCRRIDCRELIEVKTLHGDEAWILFKETLGQEMNLTPQVEEIAKFMAKVCDGLPLGIITVAGSMKGETDIHVWSNALAEVEESIMGLDEMEEKVFKVLKYSFDRLDQNHKREGTSNGYTKLQRCFLYCSLYPEDYPIGRKALIRKFILEELVDKRKSRKALFDQGHAILNKLVNVCLLESTDYWKSEGNEGKLVDAVKMHDVVRAMALKITEGKTMVRAGNKSLKEIPNEEEWTMDLEKMSLMNNDIREIPAGMSPNCPKLSTLFLQGNRNLESIPDSFFSHMHGLSILDLSETEIKELPNSLSDLESLNALLLINCWQLSYVPCLGKLTALRELDLSNTRIKEVPQGIENLINLKCLSMHRTNQLEMLPKGLLLRFPSLQCLKLPYQIQAPVEEIERLKQLEEFRGRVKDMCDFNRLSRSRQSRVHKTPHIIIVGSTYDDNWYDGPKEVILNECDLKKGEEKDVTMLAQDIHHLQLVKCKGLSDCLLDDIRRLSNPTSLETLIIDNCNGTNEQFLMAQEEFESLSLPPPQAAFFSLRELLIFRCNKLKKLGLPVSEIPNLAVIIVKWCAEIEEIIEVADDDRRGEGEGEAPVVISLPKLKNLNLAELPRLKSISNATMICSSIETIQLWGCPALKKLPLYFPASTTVDGQPYYSPPPALRFIRMDIREREWWESMEWEHPTHYHLLQPFCFYNGTFTCPNGGEINY